MKTDNCVCSVWKMWFVYCWNFVHGYRRVTRNDSFFTELEQAVLSLPATRTAVGGNAPVMAKRLVEEGVDVVLGAQMSSSLRKQLHPNIRGTFVITPAWSY